VTILQTSASPQLLAKLLAGSRIEFVEVEWWEQAATGKVRTARLLLEEVFVTSLSSGAGDDRPVDNVSFLFSKMTSTVWARTPTGIGVPKTTCWDVAQNRSCD
jgi:type VI protein secretion system component Hcp